MSRLFGQATIRVNGKVYNTKKGAKLNPGGTKRTPRLGSHSTGGFTEERVNSQLDCVVLIGEGDSIVEINRITDATIEFECDTGQSYIIRGGYCLDPVELTEGEGEGAVVFAGPMAQELL